MLSRLDLDAIIPNPDQPRKSFDDKALNELADSIAKNGDQHRILTLVRRGKLVGWKAVRNAVDALLNKDAQGGMFGPMPEASDDDLSTISGMERRIDSVAAMIGRGWKDGECTIASKVAPDRSGRMADKISAMMSALRIMERELRNSAAQTAALFDAA